MQSVHVALVFSITYVCVLTQVLAIRLRILFRGRSFVPLGQTWFGQSRACFSGIPSSPSMFTCYTLINH